MQKQIKCFECGCTTDSPLPHPQDPEGKVMICEDCEYAITCRFDSLEDEPIKNYADRRGV